MFGGKGIGGGSGDGGSMLRQVARVVSARTGVPAAAGAALQEPISSSTSTTTSTSRPTHKPISSNNLSLSSTSSPFASHNNNIPTSATSGAPTWPPLSQCDDFEWVSVDGSESGHGYLDDFIFGPAPSKDEVQDAVSALQQ